MVECTVRSCSQNFPICFAKCNFYLFIYLFIYRFGNYLLLLFLFSKLCYLGNVIGQLFLLSVVLSTKYTTFGVDIVREMVNNRDWSEDAYVAFPRVTLCDFKVRGQDMANVHAYTIQCVLPINLYNEKIYVFLWYWMLFVAVVTGLSFAVWLFRGLLSGDRISFVENHLILGGQLSSTSETDARKKLIRKFTTKYLRSDGVFVLRLIAHNTNSITTTEIICALWSSWYDRQSSDPGVREVDTLTGNDRHANEKDSKYT